MNTQHTFTPANIALLTEQLHEANNQWLLNNYPLGCGIKLNVVLYEDETFSISFRTNTVTLSTVFNNTTPTSEFVNSYNRALELGFMTEDKINYQVELLIEDFELSLEFKAA